MAEGHVALHQLKEVPRVVREQLESFAFSQKDVEPLQGGWRAIGMDRQDVVERVGPLAPTRVVAAAAEKLIAVARGPLPVSPFDRDRARTMRQDQKEGGKMVARLGGRALRGRQAVRHASGEPLDPSQEPQRDRAVVEQVLLNV